MTFFFTQVLLSTPLIAAYALFALGIVLIYRASRVLNLAHGVMAMLPAYVAFELRAAGVPTVPAIVVAVAAGGGLGAAVEIAFVRRLRSASATAQTVGTVAVYGLVVALVARFFGTAPVSPQPIFGEGEIAVGAAGVSSDQIGLIVVSVVLTGALFALFRYTALGLAMRASASNRRAASLMGIDPDRTTQVAWIMGGSLAAIAGVLLSSVLSLDPFGFPLQALPAFVAILIGGLQSMPGALVGSAVVGLAVGVVPGLAVIPGLGSFARSIGAPQVVLAVIAFIVMARRGERLQATDARGGILE